MVNDPRHSFDKEEYLGVRIVTVEDLLACRTPKPLAQAFKLIYGFHSLFTEEIIGFQALLGSFWQLGEKGASSVHRMFSVPAGLTNHYRPQYDNTRAAPVPRTKVAGSRYDTTELIVGYRNAGTMNPLRYDKMLKTSLNILGDDRLRYLKQSLSVALVPLVAAALSFLVTGPAVADAIAGDAMVIDGRTLEVAGRKVRLWGIDSPDLDQTCTWSQKAIPCGHLAQGALKDLIIGASVRCEMKDPSNGSLSTAVCFADSYDIGANMIHTGWALTREPTSAMYQETERKARAARPVAG